MDAFNYHKPSSLAEAVALHRDAEDPAYLSGGHTLLPTMTQRLATPSDLIDLEGLTELTGIAAEGRTLSIGAFTRHAEVAASAEVRSTVPALADLAEGIGDAQVRNRGTIGGSLANSDPSADYPAAALALNAVIRTDRRQIAADDYFRGLFETALEEDEIITRIDFAIPSCAAYEKFPNPASRYATVGVMVADFNGTVRVGVTGAGPCACRAPAFEAALSARVDPAALDDAELPAIDFNSDLHASAEYRAHLVRVMAQRATARLVEAS
ncbi:MAG: xanthine dehydrogenase family protein subunit M [Gammaproteobacteria bacterium]|nr:xanthine dehydrogenase family protein subunit M [Gammaproteobacteria bacterium]MYK82622.1 xanthine dehydrogenase family protein subunit M [Gammaproteobacteria bacterium]